MKICLKTAAEQSAQTIQLRLEKRLPLWIESPFQASCIYTLSKLAGYYMLDLTMDAVIPIVCQRCLERVLYPFHYETTLAICSSDEQMERLMMVHECVLASDNQIDLVELFTDELHLNAIEIPHELEDCHLDLSLFT